MITSINIPSERAKVDTFYPYTTTAKYPLSIVSQHLLVCSFNEEFTFSERLEVAGH